jgi:nucleoside-diphosphate-sugar epimerase
MTQIAITGGSGGIGRAVTELALARGHRVVSIDRVRPARRAQLPGVAYLKVDVTRYADFERALEGCRALIHLAAIPSPRGNEDYVVHNNNVVGSYNALSAAVRLGIRRVCQASSVNATGLSYSRAASFDYLPLDEEHPTYSEDPYSLSKWICEQQGDAFARRYSQMKIASLRFHWVVPDRSLPARYFKVRKSQAKSLWGYTTFDAAARACLLSITAPFKGHEAFYIVAPDTCVDVPSLELKQKYFPDVPLRGRLSGHQSFFNCAKAERLLGWRHNPD